MGRNAVSRLLVASAPRCLRVATKSHCSGVGMRRTSPLVAIRWPWRIISMAVFFLVYENRMVRAVVEGILLHHLLKIKPPIAAERHLVPLRG